MRQSDIFTIIIIAAVGTLASYFIVNGILGDPDMKYAEIKTINPISADLAEPDPELFNPEAINPTVEVYVGKCQDIDGNGILSYEEQVKCKMIIQEEDPTQGAFHCPDGTVVADISICEEVEEQEEQEYQEGY